MHPLVLDTDRVPWILRDQHRNRCYDSSRMRLTQLTVDRSGGGGSIIQSCRAFTTAQSPAVIRKFPQRYLASRGLTDLFIVAAKKVQGPR